ncbi:MAG: superoxide dismutase family protein [Acidimicrobiaceae bacterium]|nr:superoxide dismutase family protein [Acidimicrobiaceae bacterium]
MKHRSMVIASGAALAAGLVVAKTADARSLGQGDSRERRGRQDRPVEFRTDDGHYRGVGAGFAGAPGVGGFHGFHIHANDAPANGDGCVGRPDRHRPATWFVSADGHYNPTGAGHPHHVGDMPVVYVSADGSVETRFRDRAGSAPPTSMAGWWSRTRC